MTHTSCMSQIASPWSGNSLIASARRLSRQRQRNIGFHATSAAGLAEPFLQTLPQLMMPMPYVPLNPVTVDEQRVLLEHLQASTAILGTELGLNVVAFSGGVDSSLAAFLVHSVFEEASLAVLGVSAAVPQEQQEAARLIADYIGIEMMEVPTREGVNPSYIANDGTACYHCKESLYSTLHDVGTSALEQSISKDIVLFNGTNRNDLEDPTRLGLLAADAFCVVSPLASIPKRVVRDLSKLVGLPNWNWAASPCLRSRLAYGVPATPHQLQSVGAAEKVVRKMLDLQPQHSMRVRVLTQGEAVVEVEAEVLQVAQQMLPQLSMALASYGLLATGVRLFQSGSLSGALLQS